MFSKQAKTTTPDSTPAKFDAAHGAQPEARKTPQVASLIGENLTIEGSIAGEGELHLDGVIRGDLRIGKLTIGETGHVEGSISAETVEIRGRIIGTLTAKQVRLYSTAYVDGDITHEQLAIEQGAFFQGRSLKFQRQTPAIVTVVEKEAEAKSA